MRTSPRSNRGSRRLRHLTETRCRRPLSPKGTPRARSTAAFPFETPEELEALRAAGRVVADAIRAMRAHTRPGVSTGELDEIGGSVFAKAGARSGPQLDYGFPGVNCISVNDEAVHGIPGKRLASVMGIWLSSS